MGYDKIDIYGIAFYRKNRSVIYGGNMRKK